MDHRGPAYRFLTHPVVLLVLCIGLLVWLGRQFGPLAIVIAAMPVAAILSRPLINLAFTAHENAREAVWLPEHGEFYAFRDVRIHVVEDDEGWRWVPVPDARKLVPLKVSDDALRRLYPDRCAQVEKGRVLHLRSDALVEYLARSTDDTALRFRTWVDRTISEPARRQRLGHRD